VFFITKWTSVFTETRLALSKIESDEFAGGCEQAADGRPAMVVDAVNGLHLQDVEAAATGGPAGSGCQLALRNVSGGNWPGSKLRTCAWAPTSTTVQAVPPDAGVLLPSGAADER
jgi:hypothetical protein